MASASKKGSMEVSGRFFVPAATPRPEKDEDCGIWEQSGVKTHENMKRSPRSFFSFARLKFKKLECKKRSRYDKTTTAQKMKIIGTTKEPSKERAPLTRTITMEKMLQFESSKKAEKNKNYLHEKHKRTNGTKSSGVASRDLERGKTKRDSKRDLRISSKRSTKKPLNRKGAEAYAKINPIVDPKAYSETSDRGIIRRTSRTSSDGDFTTWERSAMSPLELFFAKSSEEMLAPKVLFDEESFYEGSFDEEFLSEDNEKLERCRILEERVSSRLEKAVKQDDGGSIVSLDGISMFDFQDDDSDSDSDTSSQTRTDRLISKSKTSETVVSTSRSRFDFEKAKPMFVSPWKSKHVESKPDITSDAKVEATQKARMSSLRKLFRRKSRIEVRSKDENLNKFTVSRPEKSFVIHHSSDLEGKIETRSDEANRSTERDRESPEDREEEQASDSEYEFMDEFPFDSCYILACQ